MKTRRRFSAALKAKVALEAIRGEQPISEVASKHQLDSSINPLVL
jgi:transposase-like protein